MRADGIASRALLSLASSFFFAAIFACSGSSTDATSATPVDDAGATADATAPPSPPPDATNAGDDSIVVKPKPGGKGFAGAYSSPTIVRDGSTCRRA